MVTVFHHTPVNVCTVFKQFDRVNFDGQVESVKNVKFPCQNFALYGTCDYKYCWCTLSLAIEAKITKPLC